MLSSICLLQQEIHYQMFKSEMECILSQYLENCSKFNQASYIYPCTRQSQDILFTRLCLHCLSSKMDLAKNDNYLKILSIGTDKFEQTVQTQFRLLQSAISAIPSASFGCITAVKKSNCSIFRTIMVITYGPIFLNFCPFCFFLN